MTSSALNRAPIPLVPLSSLRRLNTIHRTLLGTNFPARATFHDSNQLGSPSINRSEKILAIVYSDCIGLAPTDVGKMLLSIT